LCDRIGEAADHELKANRHPVHPEDNARSRSSGPSQGTMTWVTGMASRSRNRMKKTAPVTVDPALGAESKRRRDATAAVSDGLTIRPGASAFLSG